MVMVFPPDFEYETGEGEEEEGGGGKKNKHKDLFPLDQSDIWGLLFTSLGLMVAAGGGIGE